MARIIYFKKSGAVTAAISNYFKQIEKDIVYSGEQNVQEIAQNLYDIMTKGAVKLPEYTGTFKRGILLENMEKDNPKIAFTAKAEEQWSQLSEEDQSKFANYPNRVKAGNYSAVVIAKNNVISKAIKLYNSLRRPLKFKVLNRELEAFTRDFELPIPDEVLREDMEIIRKYLGGRSRGYSTKAVSKYIRKQLRPFRGSRYSKRYMKDIRQNIRHKVSGKLNMTKKR